MLLIEFDTESSTIVMNLLEVKFRQDGGITPDLTMKEIIEDQLRNSLEAIRILYDPNYTVPDRYDRLILTKELSTLLGFYLDRAVRYRLVSIDQANRIRMFIEHIDYGYSIRFNRSGIVFKLGEEGYRFEKDGEVIYHYLGIDRARNLIALAQNIDEPSLVPVLDNAYSPTRSTFSRRLIEESAKLSHNAAEDVSIRTSNNIDVIGGKTIEKPETEVTNEAPVSEIDLSEMVRSKLECDVILGAKHPTPQFGVLGHTGGNKIGLDLNGTNAISIFGVQGSGKSYTVGSILEMAVMPIPGINQLLKPLAAVVFHYSKTEDYLPEYVSMNIPNDGPEIKELEEMFGARPKGVPEIMILVPDGKLDERRAEFSSYQVEPIAFDTSELDIEDWKL